MISVVCFLWVGLRRYTAQHVNLLARQVNRHLSGHRFICVTDRPDSFDPGVEIVTLPYEVRSLGKIRSPEGSGFPSSYRRLGVLSPWAECLGDKVLVLDIDCFVTGALDPLVSRDEDFVGWRPTSKWGKHPRLGGGTWMHRPGTRTDLWDRLMKSPHREIAAARVAGYRGSDQALLSYWLADKAPYWTIEDGIYSAQDGVRGWEELPANARIVHFNGTKSKPWTAPQPWALEAINGN